MLKRFHEAAVIKPVDKVGMLLFIVWVAALQIMLDEGKILMVLIDRSLRARLTAVIGSSPSDLGADPGVPDRRPARLRHRGFSPACWCSALPSAPSSGSTC